MQSPYKATLAAVTAGFPTTAYTPRDVRNRVNDNSPITETGTIPANTPYTVELDYVILKSATLTVTRTNADLSTTVLTAIPWGQTPTADEVAVSWTIPLMQFHADSAGLGISVAYTPREPSRAW